MNDDPSLVAGTLNLHLRDTGMEQLGLHDLANFDVLMEELGIVLPGIPPRVPCHVVAQPVPDWMRFLTHRILPQSALARL